jgi:phosphate starvation-inducible PhoH-like protein
VLRDVDDVSFVDLGRNDIVRHSLVARIVDAYDRAQGAHAAGGAAGRETGRHGE